MRRDEGGGILELAQARRIILHNLIPCINIHWVLGNTAVPHFLNNAISPFLSVAINAWSTRSHKPTPQPNRGRREMQWSLQRDTPFNASIGDHWSLQLLPFCRTLSRLQSQLTNVYLMHPFYWQYLVLIDQVNIYINRKATGESIEWLILSWNNYLNIFKTCLIITCLTSGR